jgi:hypothetical protein
MIPEVSVPYLRCASVRNIDHANAKISIERCKPQKFLVDRVVVLILGFRMTHPREITKKTMRAFIKTSKAPSTIPALLWGAKSDVFNFGQLL